MVRPVFVELDAVLSIARRGSFRAAALELGTSTTALSNAIAKLEQRLGIRQFNRTTRSVSLTDAGKVFVERVGPAMVDIHDAMHAAQSLQDTPTGTLRINAFASAAREVMAPLILPFLRRHPQVHVDLVTEGLQAGICLLESIQGARPANGRLDCNIAGSWVIGSNRYICLRSNQKVQEQAVPLSLYPKGSLELRAAAWVHHEIAEE